MEQLFNTNSTLRELCQLLIASGFSVEHPRAISDSESVLDTPDMVMNELTDFGEHRHVAPSRVLDIFSMLQLKSLLYSPLNVVGSTFPTRQSPIHEQIMLRKLGVCGGREFRERQFDLMLKSLTCQWTVYGHRYLNIEETIQPCPVYCAVLDKSFGTHMVSGADDGLIKIWDIQSGVLVSTLLGHSGEVCDLAFSPKGLFLASLCSEDCTVVLWKRCTSFNIHYRFTEMDLNDLSRRSIPLYLSFIGENDDDFKLVIAYSNGTVVVHRVCNEIVSLWNKVVQHRVVELKAFATTAAADPATVHVIVGLGPRVVGYTISEHGDSVVTEYEFASHSRSPVSHIAPCTNGKAFVASDDEASSLVLYDENGCKPLLSGLLSGDAILIDGSSLLTRLDGLKRLVALNVGSERYRVTVDITAWTLNDFFILSSISVKSLKNEEGGSAFCVLVFSPITGQLLGAVATHADSIYNIIPISSPCGCYFATAGHDGQFSVYKLGHGTTCEFMTGFNLNFAHMHSNSPRSILDCQISDSLDVAISDSHGCVSFLSNKVCSEQIFSEGFFHNDYAPLDGQDSRVVTIDSGGVRVTASMNRLGTVESTPILGGASGMVALEGYATRFGTGFEPEFQNVLRDTKFVPLEIPRVGKPVDSRAEHRGERLRNLAAQRAAADSEAVRNGRAMHEDEFELYENSEIDDEDASEGDDYDDEEESSSRRRGTRRSARNVVTRREPRGSSRREQNVQDSREARRNMRAARRGDFSEEEQPPVRVARTSTPLVSVTTKLELNISRPVGTKCTLCYDPSSDRLIGPFLIADFPDCYFHESCLMTLSNLSVSVFPLTFGNLDILVHQAKQTRCSHCQKTGAGIKCSQCRSVFHYPCSLIVASACGLELDPNYDRQYICSRCEPRSESQDLDIFFRRKTWRKKPQVREWILRTFSKVIYVPQIGDIVCYYPPGLSNTYTLVSEIDSVFASTDLCVLTERKDGEPIVGKVAEIEYVFPSFFDPEQYAIIQKIRIEINPEKSVWTHYRPKTNGSDYLVLKSRVDCALALPPMERGDTVIVPVEDSEAISAQIVKLRNNPNRPGWESLELIDEQGEKLTLSIWEIDLPDLINDGIIEDAKTSFLINWIKRIQVGDAVVSGRRPRITIPAGSDLFVPPPWESDGAQSYLEQIKCPMYLDLIAQRLREGYYRSNESLKAEIDLVTRNCATFNDPNCILVHHSTVLVASLQALVDLPVEDQQLCLPPPMPLPVRNEPTRISASSSRDAPRVSGRIRIDRSPEPSSERLRSIRVDRSPRPTRISANGLEPTLVCDHCHASRKVGRDLYTNFVGKSVRCRSIGYACESPDSLRIGRNVSIRVPRQTRAAPVQYYQEDEDDISEVSSDETSRRRTKRGRRS